MNPKSKYLACFVAGLGAGYLFLRLFSQHNQIPPAPVGRFAVVAGTYDSLMVGPDGIEHHDQKRTFIKLDTQNGDSWLYSESAAITTNGNLVEIGWEPIIDKFEP